jgi:hypothetical protein
METCAVWDYFGGHSDVSIIGNSPRDGGFRSFCPSVGLLLTRGSRGICGAGGTCGACGAQGGIEGIQ